MKALDWCMDNGLTAIWSSDVHNLVSFAALILRLVKKTGTDPRNKPVLPK